MARDCKITHENPTDFCEVSNSPVAWAAKYLTPVNCKHDPGHKQMLLHITFSQEFSKNEFTVSKVNGQNVTYSHCN